jgi:hypothetical protein
VESDTLFSILHLAAGIIHNVNEVACEFAYVSPCGRISIAGPHTCGKVFNLPAKIAWYTPPNEPGHFLQSLKIGELTHQFELLGEVGSRP